MRLEINLQLFGGRGSSSGGLETAHPNGSAPSNKGGKWTNSPNVQSPDTLGQALGKKSATMGITRAAQGANPYYDGSYREFSENCQRAVIAYEARRRGYNVEAQPTHKGDILPNRTPGDNGHWMGAFQGAKTQNVGAKNSKKAQQNLESQMKTYGNGSRGIMRLNWKNGDGHVINVEQRGGKTLYIDAQIGKKYNGKELFSQIKPQSVRLIRTDNLKFSERAKKSVEKAGSRK